MASDDDISVDRGASQPPLPPHPQASDDAELHTVSDSANCAENYYKNEGSSLKMLVAMCHGLRDGDGDESLVIDLTAYPSATMDTTISLCPLWNTITQQSTVNTTATMVVPVIYGGELDATTKGDDGSN